MKSSATIHPATPPSSHLGMDWALESACVLGTMQMNWLTTCGYRRGFNVQNPKTPIERTGFQSLP